MSRISADEKIINSLEEYTAVLLRDAMGLKAFDNNQAEAIEVGILTEDQAERANTIIWDIRRLIKQVQQQLHSVFELIPEDLNFKEIISNIQKKEEERTKKEIEKLRKLKQKIKRKEKDSDG